MHTLFQQAIVHLRMLDLDVPTKGIHIHRYNLVRTLPTNIKRATA